MARMKFIYAVAILAGFILTGLVMNFIGTLFSLTVEI